MLIYVFAVYDSKARVYSQPFFTINEDVAKRMFATSVNDRSTNLSRSPLDFSLFALGTYDDELGTFENYATPTNLGLASNYVETVNAS